MNDPDIKIEQEERPTEQEYVMNEERHIEFVLDTEERKDDKMRISGYAIRFNSLSEDLGGFVEQIMPEALNEVDLTDTYLLSQHRSEDILGSTASKTMNVTLTDKGLHFSAELPETSLGRDTYELVKRGDLKSMSFGFTVGEDKWDINQVPTLRSITKIKELRELSLVTNPAYKVSEVSVRRATDCNKISGCINKSKDTKLMNEAQELLKSVLYK